MTWVKLLILLVALFLIANLSVWFLWWLAGDM